MGSNRGVAPVLAGLGLVGCGVAAAVAWRNGLWGLLAGAGVATIWLCASIWWSVMRASWPPRAAIPPKAETDDATALRLLLDAAPTPLVAIDGGTAHVLNRAARRLFATDDRILPAPAGLCDLLTPRLRHEGRNWRVDRVEVTNAGPARIIAALIDIDQEERAAEARATADMIQILGHELLNGLAPIASLAESGLAAVAAPQPDPALLFEILGTLARRAEGLQRFAEAYRALARLPTPVPQPASVRELTEDLARLFAGRWPHVALRVEAPGDLSWPLDRDQMNQAIWALAQNAAEAATAGPARPAWIGLSARVTEEGLTIAVADSGAGVPAENVDRIFRPFHTTKPDGTGIGLSLARHIAHAHGGTLVLEPALPTTFRLLLPNR